MKQERTIRTIRRIGKDRGKLEWKIMMMKENENINCKHISNRDGSSITDSQLRESSEKYGKKRM